MELDTHKRTTELNGINASKSKALEYISLSITSIENNYTFNLQCIVLDTITNHLPTVTFNKSKLLIPSDIKLSDNAFNKLSSICKNMPNIINTKLGWVVAGP